MQANPDIPITPVRNNPLYDKMRAMLKAADYTHTRSFREEDHEHSPEDRFEFWSGRKGTVIVQVWKDGVGAQVYANWSLGFTVDEFKEAL